MEKSRKRAMRRHHMARLKQKTKQYSYTWDYEQQRHGVIWHPSLANTPKPCSCQGCGNPRNADYGKEDDRLTMQERRALIDENEQCQNIQEIMGNQYLYAA